MLACRLANPGAEPQDKGRDRAGGSVFNRANAELPAGQRLRISVATNAAIRPDIDESSLQTKAHLTVLTSAMCAVIFLP
jgi:hypothetical protein